MKLAKVYFTSIIIMIGFLMEGESQITIGTTEIDTNTIAANLAGVPGISIPCSGSGAVAD